VVTSVVTPEEGSALDQAMVDLEIQTWETLEERVNPPPSTRDAETGGTDGNADVGMNEQSFSIEEEERALTAGALNDLFYLVDAQADAVSALEAVFGDSGAASWDEDEEDDPEDLASQARIDEIRKLFEVVDERDLDDEDDEGEK
jgi:hypothetical protein